jgi:hypothetical protein
MNRVTTDPHTTSRAPSASLRRIGALPWHQEDAPGYAECPAAAYGAEAGKTNFAPAIAAESGMTAT